MVKVELLSLEMNAGCTHLSIWCRICRPRAAHELLRRCCRSDRAAVPTHRPVARRPPASQLASEQASGVEENSRKHRHLCHGLRVTHTRCTCSQSSPPRSSARATSIDIQPLTAPALHTPRHQLHASCQQHAAATTGNSCALSGPPVFGGTLSSRHRTLVAAHPASPAGSQTCPFRSHSGNQRASAARARNAATHGLGTRCTALRCTVRAPPRAPAPPRAALSPTAASCRRL